MKEILSILEADGFICHAPTSGGLMLLDAYGEKSSFEITLEQFLQLRKNDKIDHYDSANKKECHILNGHVDCYRLVR